MGRIKIDEKKDITVCSQEEFDKIPKNFKGNIFYSGDDDSGIAVSYTDEKRYVNTVIVSGASRVCAYGNAKVIAYDNSVVHAFDRATVIAHNDSRVCANGKSSVVANDYSQVDAWSMSIVVANDYSRITAAEMSTVIASNCSRVTAYEDSVVKAGQNATVFASGNSTVTANGNVQVYAFDNSDIQVSGNARIISECKTINEYMDFANIKHDDKTALFYKCAIKTMDNTYQDVFSKFIYEIGTTIGYDCGDYSDEENRALRSALRLYPLDEVLQLVDCCDDLVILECESDISDISYPAMRTSRLKILREIPFEECGAYGKILAKMRK